MAKRTSTLPSPHLQSELIDATDTMRSARDRFIAVASAAGLSNTEINRELKWKGEPVKRGSGRIIVEKLAGDDKWHSLAEIIEASGNLPEAYIKGQIKRIEKDNAYEARVEKQKAGRTFVYRFHRLEPMSAHPALAVPIVEPPKDAVDNVVTLEIAPNPKEVAAQDPTRILERYFTSYEQLYPQLCFKAEFWMSGLDRKHFKSVIDEAYMHPLDDMRKLEDLLQSAALRTVELLDQLRTNLTKQPNIVNIRSIKS